MFTIKYKKMFSYKSKYSYTITNIRDLSRPSSERYSVIVGLKKQYNKDEIKQIIKEVNDEVRRLKKSYFYKKDIIDTEGGLMYERNE